MKMKQHVKEQHPEEYPFFACSSCAYFSRDKTKTSDHYKKVHLTMPSVIPVSPTELKKKKKLAIANKKKYKYDRYNCHLCYQNGIPMGITTRPRLYRHWKFHHGILNPEVEDTEANQEMIRNPPPLPKIDHETRRELLCQQRKTLGIHFEKKSSGSRKGCKRGLGEFQCEFCSKRYNEKRNLNSHIKKVHEKKSNIDNANLDVLEVYL